MGDRIVGGEVALQVDAGGEDHGEPCIVERLARVLEIELARLDRQSLLEMARQLHKEPAIV